MITSFLDKVIIYILGSIALVLSYNEEDLVAYLLIGLIVLGISQCLHDSKHYIIEMIVSFAFLVLVVNQPNVGYYIGIWIYAIVFRNIKNRGKSWVYLFVYMTFVIYIMLTISVLQMVLFLFIMVFASIMGIKTYKLQEMKDRIKKIRDDSSETELALKEMNKYLQMNQDKEIHIATLNERNRIAREIHDNVGHMLSRAMLQLGAYMTIEKNETSKVMLVSIKDTLNEAMTNIRESVHDLHKDSFDLKEAVEKVIADMDNYDIKLECSMSEGAKKEIKYAFLAILKEALTNIVKHSNADKIFIAMVELDNYCQMVIEDNGVVKENIDNINAGIGLINMEERIKKLSGVISFGTNNGFRIFVSVPKSID